MFASLPKGQTHKTTLKTGCLTSTLLVILCPLWYCHNMCFPRKGWWKFCSTKCRFHCETQRDSFSIFLLLSSLPCCQDEKGKEDRCDLAGMLGHGHYETFLLLVLERKQANGNTLLLPKQAALAVWHENKYNTCCYRKIIISRVVRPEL